MRRPLNYYLSKHVMIWTSVVTSTAAVRLCKIRNSHREQNLFICTQITLIAVLRVYLTNVGNRHVPPRKRFTSRMPMM